MIRCRLVLPYDQTWPWTPVTRQRTHAPTSSGLGSSSWSSAVRSSATEHLLVDDPSLLRPQLVGELGPCPACRCDGLAALVSLHQLLAGGAAPVVTPARPSGLELGRASRPVAGRRL